jgi:hypothetical protein
MSIPLWIILIVIKKIKKINKSIIGCYKIYQNNINHKSIYYKEL